MNKATTKDYDAANSAKRNLNKPFSNKVTISEPTLFMRAFLRFLDQHEGYMTAAVLHCFFPNANLPVGSGRNKQCGRAVILEYGDINRKRFLEDIASNIKDLRKVVDKALGQIAANRDMLEAAIRDIEAKYPGFAGKWLAYYADFIKQYNLTKSTHGQAAPALAVRSSRASTKPAKPRANLVRDTDVVVNFKKAAFSLGIDEAQRHLDDLRRKMDNLFM